MNPLVANFRSRWVAGYKLPAEKVNRCYNLDLVQTNFLSY